MKFNELMKRRRNLNIQLRQIDVELEKLSVKSVLHLGKSYTGDPALSLSYAENMVSVRNNEATILVKEKYLKEIYQWLGKILEFVND